VTTIFSFFALAEALGRHVSRPERLRNDYFGIGKLFVENAVGTLFARGDDILMSV